MFLNLTLLYLSTGGYFSSPIITSNENLLSQTYQFNNIYINKNYNSFFYKFFYNNHKATGNQYIFKKSTFSRLLNSAIKMNKDVLFEDSIYNAQQYFDSSTYPDVVTVINCCFSDCSGTRDNGGAIFIDYVWSNLKASSTVFVRCRCANEGGAIYSIGMNMNLQDIIFVENQAGNSGGAVYYNLNASLNGQMQTEINETLVSENISPHSPMNVCTLYHNKCTHCNFSHNRNTVSNIQSSSIQNCVGYRLCISQRWQESLFQFNNFVGNDGDFVLDLMPCCDSNKVGNINVINNVNLNFFFRYEQPPSVSADSNVYTNIAFFGNRPKSGNILIANKVNNNLFVLKYCFCDWKMNDAPLILNGYTMENSSFDISNVITFDQNDNFLRPTKCRLASEPFTKSSPFSHSELFSKSWTFSFSQLFSNSLIFSSSNAFSSSAIFSKSEKFSASNFFSRSSAFSSSAQFSKSVVFTRSDKFSLSELFSKSLVFTRSDNFSPSTGFTKSSDFSFSTQFSPSSGFTKSSSFSHSHIFSSTRVFSISSEFSLSSSFTASSDFGIAATNIFSSSSTFSPSSPFTPSFTFSPARTKPPDPMNFIDGRTKNSFSKEELKKQAAPASISLIIIIASIVLSVFYIRRKIKEVRDHDNIPDFDASFNDENDDTESEYSYSYYTYSYVYSSECYNSLSESIENSGYEGISSGEDDEQYSSFTYDEYDVYDDEFLSYY